MVWIFNKMKVFFQATWWWNKNKTATFESMDAAATQSSWITVGYLHFLYMRNLAVHTKKFFSFSCIYFLNSWTKSLSACFKRQAVMPWALRETSFRWDGAVDMQELVWTLLTSFSFRSHRDASIIPHGALEKGQIWPQSAGLILLFVPLTGKC